MLTRCLVACAATSLHAAPALAQGLAIDLRASSGGDRTGSSLAPVGDVDGDGLPDLASGDAGGLNSSGGGVIVFSGATGRDLYRPFVDSASYSAGFSLARLGDLDGDGIAELAAGDELWGTPTDRPGSVTITQGGTGALIELLIGEDTLDLFGWSIDRVPDVDLDGIPEIAVGAPGADAGGRGSGAVLLYSGASRARLWRIDGSEVGGALGYVVRGASDFDGDGRGDVVVSEPSATSSTGDVAAGRVLVLSGVDGSIVQVFEGETPHEGFGRSLAVVGDGDGDGRDDLIVGAPFASTAAFSGGRVDLISSATGGSIWSFAGTGFGESLGDHVGAVGDLDGDGTQDAAFTRGLDVFDPESGQAFAVSVATGSILYSVPAPLLEADRRPLAGTGDLSGDGLDDLAVGAPRDGVVRVHQLGDRPGGSICDGEPNSVLGLPALLSASSSTAFWIQANDADLNVIGLPIGPGYFLVARSTGTLPMFGGGEGTLCLGMPLGRYSDDVLIPQNTALPFDPPSGPVSLRIDNTSIPQPTGAVAAAPGDTFYFQYWYRDVDAIGAATSNLSNAIAITFR
ncbi:MAG: integrin alpha [Planctomycetota bacterium]